MTAQNIDLLISNHNFAFQAWNDRYGKGVWAVCTPNSYHATAIYDEAESRAFEMVERTSELLNTDWLPIVIEDSLVEAIAALETRLAKLPTDQLVRGSIWSSAVFDAIEQLQEGRFQPLPKTFAEVATVGGLFPKTDEPAAISS